MVLLLCTLAGSPARAQPAEPLPAGGFRLLEDPSRTRTLHEVRADALGWRPAAASVAPGFSRSVWWLRVAIENPGAQPRRVVLDLKQPLQDFVTWHVLDANGALLFEQADGDRVPFSGRSLAQRSLALPLTLPPHTAREVFVRLDTHDGLFETLTPTLSSAEGFEAANDLDALLQGLYFGALLALTIYNLLVWLSSRERGFGLYTLYAASFLCWSFTYRGFGFALLWPASPRFQNQLLPIAAAASLIGFTAFSISYLRLASRAPRWQWRALQAAIVLNLLTVPLALADRYAWAFAWCIPVGLATMLLGAFASFGQGRRGHREGWLSLGSFLPLGAGASITLLQVAGLLPPHPWLSGLWQAGSAFQMLVLALGLADTLNRLKQQALVAERAARDIQARLAVDLEAQVRERTSELQAVNVQLARLSITDALTGAFNRRHFDQRCSELLQARRRTPAPVALCMIDIDHFKAFNDRYGHPAGDQTLIAVTAAIRARLRRADDELFRLGGEEFGVLFTSTSAALAAEFVEELRLAVRALAIPHAGSAGRVVTASFGVGYWGTGALDALTPTAMYSVADASLYAAKTGGRDRVVMSAAAAG